MFLQLLSHKKSQNIAKYSYFSAVVFMSFYSSLVYTAPLVKAFSLAMPNRFWPNTTSVDPFRYGIGNQIQRETAANNPDVFCEFQGDGYRLPSVGEINSSYRVLNPGHTYFNPPYSPTIRTSLVPGHWANYSENDIGKSRLPNVSGRVVSGSVGNEWGALSSYGWSAGSYVVTEISVIQTRAVSGQPSAAFGRIFFDSTSLGANGVLGYVSGVVDAINRPSYNNSPGYADYSHYVACVRDLIVTPATPSPSKT